MNVSSQTLLQKNDEADLSALLHAISNKDESALSQLYDLSVNKVYGLAFKILHNEADAEEVVCDVYSQLWHKAANYCADRGSALSWLLLICRSRAVDLLRKKRPEYSANDDVLALTECENNPQPEDIIHMLQQGTAIHLAMQQLSAIQRQLIALAYFKDLTHSEISTAIQLPLGTVKSHLRRALQSMQLSIEL